MVDKTPAQIQSGTANDDSVVHASDATLGDLSRSHAERDISRLQGAAPAYSALKTYNIGDLVTQSTVTFRNTTAILIPEVFTPAKWKDIDGPTIPGEVEAQAVLGLTGDQVIPASAAINWDENFFFGDALKIVDEGSGVIRLHNGAFALRSHIALDIAGGGVQTAVLAWESSANVGGPFVQIPNPDARTGSFSKGDASVTTQPLAGAFVDATAADVFVRAVLTATDTTTVLSLSSGASIVSFGTSAIANTPLDTKGDLLTHNGTSEQRQPVGTDGQQIEADSAEPNGWKWVTPSAGGAAKSTFKAHRPVQATILPTTLSQAKILPATDWDLGEVIRDFDVVDSGGASRFRYTGAATKEFLIIWSWSLRTATINENFFGIIQRNSSSGNDGEQIVNSTARIQAIPNTNTYFSMTGSTVLTLNQNDLINLAGGETGGTSQMFVVESSVTITEL